MTLHYVPIIDLGPYFSGTAEGKAAVAKAVNQACRDIGFLVITQHQIPAELIERVSVGRRLQKRRLHEEPEKIQKYVIVKA